MKSKNRISTAGIVGAETGQPCMNALCLQVNSQTALEPLLQCPAFPLFLSIMIQEAHD